MLLERLRNETTRLTAVKAWGTLAGSPLVPGLGAALEPLIAELTSFLRKANRRLRQTALTTTEVVLPAAEPVSKFSHVPLLYCMIMHRYSEGSLTRHASHIAAYQTGGSAPAVTVDGTMFPHAGGGSQVRRGD